MPSGAKGRGFPQETFTPQLVAEVVYRIYGGHPDLDPWGSPRQLIRAHRVLVERIRGASPTTNPRWWSFERGDGWTVPWHGNVFGNPEFEDLGRALERAWREVHREYGADQAIILGPIRTHRNYAPWFWAANACCFMRPIAFVGTKDQFPLPLGLSYYGPFADVFRREARALGVVRMLTPWTERIIMPPMSDGTNLAADLEERKKQLVIDVARDNPQLSIAQILAELHLDADSEYGSVLLSTPLGELVRQTGAAPSVDALLEAPAKRRTPAREKKPPTNRGEKPKSAKGSNAKAGKKAAKTNGHANGHTNGSGRGGGKKSEVPAIIETFLAKKKKGDQFKTKDVIDLAGVGRAATIKHLDNYYAAGKIKMHGAGRGAYWEVR